MSLRQSKRLCLHCYSRFKHRRRLEVGAYLQISDRTQHRLIVVLKLCRVILDHCQRNSLYSICERCRSRWRSRRIGKLIDLYFLHVSLFHACKQRGNILLVISSFQVLIVVHPLIFIGLMHTFVQCERDHSAEERLQVNTQAFLINKGNLTSERHIQRNRFLHSDDLPFSSSVDSSLKLLSRAQTCFVGDQDSSLRRDCWADVREDLFSR